MSLLIPLLLIGFAADVIGGSKLVYIYIYIYIYIYTYAYSGEGR